ncbi:acyl-CoA dehydrogenase, partial [Acinetobacter baumannii]
MILNAEQSMVQEMMRNYAQNQLKPTAAHRDKTHEFPAQELKDLGALGAMGMTVPDEWGGAGMDYVSLVLAIEEIAAGDGAISTIVSVQNSLICGITLAYGSEQQKQTYLPKFASGEWLGCFCLTEPHVGSDASAIL